MTQRLPYQILSFFFCFSLLVLLAESETQKRQRTEQKLSSETLQMIDRSLRKRSGRTVKLWIFFTDKGVSKRNVETIIHRMKESASLGVLARRRKVRTEEMLFDEQDLPVNNAYAKEVLQIAKSAGGSERVRSKWLNAVSYSFSQYDQRVIEDIAQLRFVKEVQIVQSWNFPTGGDSFAHKKREAERTSGEPFDQSFYGSSHWQVSMLNVPELHKRGINGTGVKVLVLDSGFHLSHEAFSSLKMVAQKDFYKQDDDTDYQPGDHPAQTNHGSKVLGLIGGYKPNKYVGVAFGASYYLAKTESLDFENSTEEDYFAAGVEWGESKGIHLATTSLGYNFYPSFLSYDGITPPISRTVNAAIERGVVFITSNGNSGRGGLTAPSDALNIISVGSVNVFKTLAGYSSYGPTADGRTKPEVSAPGDSVSVINPDVPVSYQVGSGTSFAAPLVAGVATLVLQAHPEYSPNLVRHILMTTADRADSPSNLYGWGIVNAVAAVDFVPKQLDCSCSGHGSCRMNSKQTRECACDSTHYNFDCSTTK
eukprot:TRINITY_DN1744_c0_g1_i2.p1 TRINITY_DN1744_c0_g1~~TRINITY_DN1744_c0_g1_i2.p1  ORF type:complete len:537 (-),score=82.72 TRINITY_DN1744_c0_g1_i2:724-2334(-)